MIGSSLIMPELVSEAIYRAKAKAKALGSGGTRARGSRSAASGLQLVNCGSVLS